MRQDVLAILLFILVSKILTYLRWGTNQLREWWGSAWPSAAPPWICQCTFVR